MSLLLGEMGRICRCIFGCTWKLLGLVLLVKSAKIAKMALIVNYSDTPNGPGDKTLKMSPITILLIGSKYYMFYALWDISYKSIVI